MARTAKQLATMRIVRSIRTLQLVKAENAAANQAQVLTEANDAVVHAQQKSNAAVAEWRLSTIGGSSFDLQIQLLWAHETDRCQRKGDEATNIARHAERAMDEARQSLTQALTLEKNSGERLSEMRRSVLAVRDEKMLMEATERATLKAART